MSIAKKTFNYGEYDVTLETGKVARQADGAVMVSMGDTVLLVTAVSAKEAKPGQDFFPLIVNYQERTYAAGKIPGGFFKREGRPSEKEVLTCRLIDRPLRPLFPKGYVMDTQVVATVISLDPEIDPDIPAMLGASAAVAVAGLPVADIMAAARVGYIDGKFVLNPSRSHLKESQLDLVVAGTQDAVLMVESQAQELPEDTMLEAVFYAHAQFKTAVDAIKSLQAEAGKPRREWQAVEMEQTVVQQIADLAKANIEAAYQIKDKMERSARLQAIRSEVKERLTGDDDGLPELAEQDVINVLDKLEKEIVRSRIIAGEPRIDGRDVRTVRPIAVETSILPRTHGSALFTRGETQAVVVATLGTERDAQKIDAIEGEYRNNFMLHYNFPPYCVGETGMVGSPKRREIGHGNLAKRGISAVLPDELAFPYSIRVVSEITESNGSSSMASVCGTSLALMDAGVPISSPVAGIAMGLVKEGDDAVVLTDILGDEDHLGDMDFKVAGTEKGVTTLQMDIKVTGISKAIMETALAQARDGRLHILGIMNEELNKPRTEMSEHAPRIVTMTIDPEKIRDVIGKGGATIRALTEETGASIDITDDGVIKIAAVDNKAREAAEERIKAITQDIEVGAIYTGKVVKLMDFGAFVNIAPGKDGLVHISQIAQHRVNEVSDELDEGQEVTVKVLEIDRQGRIRLSMKDVEAETA